jgi:hypothetical protein
VLIGAFFWGMAQTRRAIVATILPQNVPTSQWTLHSQNLRIITHHQYPLLLFRGRHGRKNINGGTAQL